MAQLQLNDALLTQLQSVLEGNDARCVDDGVATQYLAAVIGLKLGNVRLPAERKRNIRDQLCAFIDQVVADVEEQDAEEAIGIWRPGQAD